MNDIDYDGESLDNFTSCNSYDVDDFVKLSDTVLNKNLHFLHLNINGCRSNFNEFQLFLNTLSFNYSIIALTETNLSQNTDFNFELDNYRSVNNYTKHGLKIYYLESVKVDVDSTYSFNDNFKETLFIRIKSHHLNNLLFGVLYRPHCSTIQQFIESFRDDILNKFRPLESIILTGDFNINLANSEISADVQDFKNLMYEFNLISSINEVTRFNSFNPNNSTIIDHFWSRIPFSYSTHIIKTNISDHYTIALHSDFCNITGLVTVKFRDSSHTNIQTLCNRFPDMLQELNLQILDPNQCVSTLLGWLTGIFNYFLPIKTKTIGLKRLKSPWITEELLTCIKKKHRFFSLMKRGRLNKDFYNRYKNMLTYVIRKSKQRYYQNSFTDSKNDPRKMWKTIHNFMNQDKISSIEGIRLPNNDVVTEPVDVAHALNESFVNCAINLQNLLPDTHGLQQFDNFPSNDNSIFLNPTNCVEVINIINSFENKNNSINDFPFKILKLISIHISPILANIFNLILTTGIYPDCLKNAKVTPIFKSGNRLSPSNYRPISVLNSINKIFERLLFIRLDNFSQAFNIISPCQYGFSSNRGINDALFDILGKVRESLIAKKHCAVTLADFSKAFDTINHQRLLMKLSRYGFRGIALDLIKSYLSDRTQVVALKNVISDPLPINHGVPQGSILGPWLFNIYVNDLAYYLNDSPPSLYADDTTLLDEDHELDSLLTRVQQTINLFYNWSIVNYLSLNTNKTKFMIFSNKKFIGPKLPLFIRNAPLEQVTSSKLLGVYIDSGLNYKEHLKNLRSKLARLVGLSYAIGPNMNIEAAKSFYYALAHSKLIYGILFWGVAYPTDIAAIQICQNKIIRNLFKDKIDCNSTIELYYRLGIFKIKDLFCLEACKAIYKARHMNKFLPLNDLLNKLDWVHNYETRGIAAFRLPNAHNNKDKNDFLFRSVSCWNNLSRDIRDSPSFYTFVKALKSNLLAQYALLI